MSQVLCQNACFLKSSHSLARTRIWHAHAEDALGVVQNLRQPCGRATPCTWGIKSLFLHSLFLLSGPSCRLTLSTLVQEKAWGTQRGPDAL